MWIPARTSQEIDRNVPHNLASPASPLAPHIDPNNVKTSFSKEIAYMDVTAGVFAQSWNHENGSFRGTLFPSRQNNLVPSVLSTFRQLE